MKLLKSLSPYNLKLAPYQKISLHDIYKDLHKQIKEVLLKSKLNVNNIPLNLTTTNTRFNGARYWIECPVCKKAVGNLYCVENTLVCRKCLRM